MQQLVAQVPWGHNIVLMEKISDLEVRKIYLQGIIQNGWGRSMLIHQIESDYYLRIKKSNNNFKLVLPENDSDLANIPLKNPYTFKVNGKLVRMSFSDTDKTAEDCLNNVLKNLYR